MSMLLVVDAGYTPQNAHTGHKITSCLGTLDQVTRTIIKPFLSNPRVVTAFLCLHDIPLWNNIFMTAGNFKALNAKKWSNEVNSNCCSSYKFYF
jgi:hypothetical protein